MALTRSLVLYMVDSAESVVAVFPGLAPRTVAFAVTLGVASLARAEENPTGLLRETRVDAAGEVLLSGGRHFKEVLGVSSAGADLVMLGVAEPGADFPPTTANLADGFGTVVFILAAQGLPFKQIVR